VKRTKAFDMAASLVRLGFDVDITGRSGRWADAADGEHWTLVVTPRGRLSGKGMTDLFDLLGAAGLEAFTSPGMQGFWIQPDTTLSQTSDSPGRTS